MERKAKRGEGRVFVHGNSWWIDITYKGTRIRERVLPVSHPKGEKEARAILKKRQVEIVEGRFLDVKKESKVTFRELAEKYINEYAKHYKKSWENSDRYYLVHLNDYFGNMQIVSITREDVLRYQTKRKSEGGPSSVNHEISLMRSIFNMAIDVWTHPENKRLPLFSGRNPATMKSNSALRKLQESHRDRYMSKGELLKFLEVAEPDLADYVLFAICTGLRKGEQRGLSAAKVDLQQNLIKLAASDTKTSIARLIPLCNIARNILQRRGCDFSRDIMRTNKKYPFGKALERAKIGNFHWHDFRRTFSTYMEECGVSAERRRRIMGHSEHKMTRTYTKIEIESLLQEVRKLDTYLMEIVPKSYFSGTGRTQTCFDFRVRKIRAYCKHLKIK